MATGMSEDEPTVLTDAKGRKLTLRTLTLLEQTRVLRAIGPAQASNEPYVQTVIAMCMIADIDGVPVLLPTNERQIDGMLDRIGNEAGVAMNVHLRKMQADAEKAAEEAMSPDPLPPSVN
jgi:hypothetical protein